MIEVMATLRITEAELAHDVHAVLAKVQEGVEVIVEQDHRAVAVHDTLGVAGRAARVAHGGAGVLGDLGVVVAARLRRQQFVVVQQALTQAMQQTALYCIVMGTVQGLTSLGGSLLSALVHSKGYDKNRARVTTAATYALFLTVQLIALLRTAPSNEGHAGDLFTLAAIGLGTFALIEHTLYAALDRERYQAVLTGFLFVSGLLLIGKSLFL